MTSIPVLWRGADSVGEMFISSCKKQKKEGKEQHKGKTEDNASKTLFVGP